MIERVSPQAAKAIVHSSQEVAFLDVREAGQFGEGHPLFAIPCPYSLLESRAPTLAPRHSVPIIVIDTGDGVAERSVSRLARMGYKHVSMVEGGAPAWAEAGFTLFKGVNVPSKTLGELAEHEWRPETIAPERAASLLGEGRLALFDGRPPAEYLKMHVPGAVCLPNGELAHRLPALNPDRPIVVGCAGRTRGIVGAIGLRLVGHDGPVYALENGTQGWSLAGLKLEHGVAAAPFPELSELQRQATRAKAEAFAKRWDIPFVDSQTVERFLEDPDRTTFAFDVRSDCEAASDPIAIAPHAPSGQLVQASDHYVGVRHSRILLCDDCGMRGALAAFWLRQLGFEPSVVIIDDRLHALRRAGLPAAPPAPTAETIEATDALCEMSEGRAQLIDLRSSQAFRANHVDGARWTLRPRLSQILASESTHLNLISDDAATLEGLLIDLAEMPGVSVRVVKGGQNALVSAGAHLVATPDDPHEETAIDFLHFVHDRHDGNLEASRRYLAWETGLTNQLDADERSEFTLIRNRNTT